MYNLFIDDEREVKNHYPGQEFVVVRSYNDAVQYVEQHGLPKFVSFDHDLGDVNTTDEKTGYSFAKYLIDFMIDNDIITPFEYYVHSANPVGAENIKCYLENGFASRRQ
jgi:hypothetical protein